MQCRVCVPPHWLATNLPVRSPRSEKNSQPTRSAIIVLTFGCTWRAQPEILLRSFGMKPTVLQSRRCGMHSGTHKHGASKCKSCMTIETFGYGFGTTERVLTRMFFVKGQAPDTTGC